jgi:hypothetical protein
MSRSELDTDTSIISETHDFAKIPQKSLNCKLEYLLLNKLIFFNLF